jgi:hypothetical protein
MDILIAMQDAKAITGAVQFSLGPPDSVTDLADTVRRLAASRTSQSFDLQATADSVTTTRGFDPPTTRTSTPRGTVSVGPTV